MAYSGRYQVLNPKKYLGDHTNVIYRSLWERDCFKWCDMNPKVKAWSSEEVIIPYYYEVDKRYHRYFPDLKIIFSNKTILVEIKPDKETIVIVEIANGISRSGLKKHYIQWGLWPNLWRKFLVN